MRSQEEYALSRLKYLLGNPTPERRAQILLSIKVERAFIKIIAGQIRTSQSSIKRFTKELGRE